MNVVKHPNTVVGRGWQAVFRLTSAVKCYTLTYPGTLVALSVKLSETRHAHLVSHFLD